MAPLPMLVQNELSGYCLFSICRANVVRCGYLADFIAFILPGKFPDNETAY